MTEKVTVKASFENFFTWWWSSFELTKDGPVNGFFRLIVAGILGLIMGISALTLLSSLIDFIVDILPYSCMVVVILIAYFMTPKYKWAEVVDYIKAQAKSVFGGTE